MFSLMSGYIWGEEQQDQEEQVGEGRNECFPSAREVDDWIIVDASSESFKHKYRDDETKQKADNGRVCAQRNQTGSQNNGRRHLQHVMFGETYKQGKMMMSCARQSRSNSMLGKTNNSKQHMNLKMAGMNKNLKQC